MSHTVTTLFSSLGVTAAVHELNRDPRGCDMERELARRLGRNPPVPAVFIGGKLVGSTDRVMSLHLGGKLVPMLKAAGAMWL
jgi:glutaredoxin 3